MAKAPKDPEWSMEVTSQISANLRGAAKSVCENACSLADDAELLYQAKRYARSAALAILAEEEFSKSYILLVCASIGRWDSLIFQGLREHMDKQAMSAGLKKFMEIYSRKQEEISRRPQYIFNPPTYPIFESKENKEVLNEVEGVFMKKEQNTLKLDALYVSIQKDGSLKATPASILKIDAAQRLEEVKKARQILQALVEGL